MLCNFRLMLATTVVLPISLVAGTAYAEPPAMSRSIGTGVTPAAGWTQLGSSTTHTAGIASSTVAAPEIRALARSLSREGTLSGDALARRVLDYVRNNIETEFRFGLGKGARGAIIDQSGTPFDQADLMVRILREAGATASFRTGTITLSADQFGKWTGLVTGLSEQNQTFTVSAKAACQFLADGGIPAQVNGGSECATRSGNLSTVTLSHVWVMTGGKAYDPSFKSNVLFAGIDIPAAMGCGTASAPTCGSTLQTSVINGASTGTQYGAPYVQNLNRAGLESRLTTQAQNLQNAIESQNAYSSVGQIAGGRKIIPVQLTSASSTLSYQQTVNANWSGNIPDQYRTTFNVQMHGLNATVFADEIAGKRIKLTTSSPRNSWSRTTELVLDGVAVASNTTTVTGPGIPNDITISVNHPFAASAGSYGDQTSVVQSDTDPRDSDLCIRVSENQKFCNMDHVSFNSLVLDVGSTGSGREPHFSALLLDDVEEQLRLEHVGLENLSSGPATLAAWGGQVNLASRILEGISQSRINPLHSLGTLFVGQDGERYFNIRSAAAINSRQDNSANEVAAFETYAALGAAIEGSVLQQSSDDYESATSVALFKLMNDSSTRFFDADATTISAVLNGSSGYSTAQKALLSSYAASGYRVIVPNKGRVGVINISPGATYDIYMVPELAYKSGSVSYLINELYKGAGALGGDETVPEEAALQHARISDDSLRSSKYWGVDLASGNININPIPDVQAGSGSNSLSFRRSYTSGAPAIHTCSTSLGDYYMFARTCSDPQNDGTALLGGSWTHNLNSNAVLTSSGDAAFGRDNALQASGAIARMYGLFDLAKESNFQKRMSSVFVTYSLINSFLRNGIKISGPTRSFTFSKLPDGSFEENSPERRATVAVTGAPSDPFMLGTSVVRDYSSYLFTVSDGNGDKISYSPSSMVRVPNTSNYVSQARYVANQVEYGSGMLDKYTYIESIWDLTNAKLKSLSDVTRSNSEKILFNYKEQAGWIAGFRRISSVGDGGGQTASYTCDDTGYWSGDNVDELRALECPLQATGLDNGVTSYAYASGDGTYANSQRPDRVLKAIYLPSSSTVPFLEVGYDPMVHVASVKDASARTTRYFVGSVSDEKWRIGEVRDPLGNVTTNVFDDRNSLISVTNPLGATATRHFDPVGRLIREIQPEGNAVEYTYDRRGNVLSECQIAKGRVVWSSLNEIQKLGAHCNSSLGDLVKTTAYIGGPTARAKDCANMKTCNKPTHVIDPRGYRTNYTWSTAHGQLLSESSGLDSAGLSCAIGSVCPQTTYGYTAFTANGATFYLLTSKVEKLDASAVRTTNYSYDAANRYVLKSMSIVADGQTQTTCYGYDAIGNLISSTEPLGVSGGCS